CILYVIFFYSFFFFQAEDGIRDFHVTGVQTCALPIYFSNKDFVTLLTKTSVHWADSNTAIVSSKGLSCLSSHSASGNIPSITSRSEERRVGKECRSRW